MQKKATSDMIVSNVYPHLLNVKKIMDTTNKSQLLEMLDALHKEYIVTLKDADVEVLQTKVIQLAQKVSNSKHSLS